MNAHIRYRFQQSTVSVIFGTGNTILHGLGFYLLMCLYMKGQGNVPQLLVINLSLVECVLNIFLIIQNSVNYQYLHLKYNKNATKEDTAVLKTLSRSLGFIGYTGLLYLYYAAMIYITVDRALAILLSFKYHHFMTKTKAKIILLATWIFNVSLIISLIVIGAVYSWNTIIRFNSLVIWYSVSYYIPAFFDFLYLVIALISYAILFSKFVKSKRQFTNDENHESLWTIFHNSKFYVSVLLIFSFLIFTIIPNLIQVGYTINNEDPSNGFGMYAIISLNLSYTVDGIIFIFLQERVRKLLKEKFCGHKHQGVSSSSATKTLLSTSESSRSDQNEKEEKV